MKKNIFALLLFVISYVANAQEAFSPSRAANEPNYLKNFSSGQSFSVAPAPTDNAITPSEVEELPPPKPPEPVFTNVATFTVIDKRTAAKETFDAQMGINVISGKLEINPVKCYINKEKIPFQHSALVEVFAPKQGKDKSLIYSGWLFANHPEVAFAASAQYDVALQACVEDEPTAPAEENKATPTDN
jgi:hypothetical protein